MYAGTLKRITGLSSPVPIQVFYWLLGVLHLVVMSAALLHALIYKRDYRAALGWVGVIVIFPVAGPALYFLFGINRVRTKAKLFAGHHLPFLSFREKFARRPPVEFAHEDISRLPEPWIGAVGGRVTNAPLTQGNKIDILVNGEAFYPQLIGAISEAQHYVLLSSYIFSTRGVAANVIEALADAVARNVKVYVLVDGIGMRYSFPRVMRPLRRAGVTVAQFFPPSLIPPSLGINLRNHRKITVIDGHTGFFGGMNIDRRHMVTDSENKHPTRDIHFRVTGPAVTDLQRLFARDWWMMTSETLDFLVTADETPGDIPCRVIHDGPDESLDYLAMTLIGIFTAARKDITIMVPYFLPSRAMIAALQSAAIRGIHVRVVLPEKSNLRFIDWATRKMLWELVLWDIEVYLSPPPFDHAKLIAIDHCYVMGGSANLDPRSLRLNFELGVEMFSSSLAATINAHIDTVIQDCRRVTLEELDNRALWKRTRDAFFWLFSGYL